MRPVIRSLMMLVAVFATFSVAEKASAQQARLEGRLTGATLASGKATFRQQGTSIRLSVEVEDAAPNKLLTITAVRGTQVLSIGTITTDALGFADLNRSGNGAVALRSGDVVVVKAGAATIVSGVLRPK